MEREVLMNLHFADRIEAKSNLTLTTRERGKLVSRRQGHNIWLNLGREWLARLIAYQSLGPDVPEDDQRVKYIGLGIGGTQQLVTPVPSPVGTVYTGTNTQTDTDPTVTVMERPVRVSGSESAYPGIAGDEWVGLVQAPAGRPVATSTVFRRVFTQLEVSYGSFLSVPLSEVGLFLSGADPESSQNTMVAYDTFDTISKTAAFELEVEWTIRF